MADYCSHSPQFHGDVLEGVGGHMKSFGNGLDLGKDFLMRKHHVDIITLCDLGHGLDIGLGHLVGKVSGCLRLFRRLFKILFLQG